MLTTAEIRKELKKLGYAQMKYFVGLRSKKDVAERFKKMKRKDYKPFKTDKGIKTKKSSYTRQFHEKYPGMKKRSLKNISIVTKIPLKKLQTIYNRGLAAWRTGHRPGATPQQWGYARVYSFVMKGKTYHTADKDLR
jgi:hypothetical protein